MNSALNNVNIVRQQNLGAVIMPLMRVMADADLSWSDREKVSAAIQACHRHWDSMEKERSVLNQQQAAGVQIAANQRPQYGV